MPKRYDLRTRWPLGAPDLPDEVALRDDVTIIRCDGGRTFRIRLGQGADLDVREVIALAEEFAEALWSRDPMDEALCKTYVAEDFADWASDQVDTGRPIEVESTA